MKAIFGMLSLRQGAVRIGGQDITTLSPQRAWPAAWPLCRKRTTSSPR